MTALLYGGMAVRIVVWRILVKSGVNATRRAEVASLHTSTGALTAEMSESATLAAASSDPVARLAFQMIDAASSNSHVLARVVETISPSGSDSTSTKW